MSNKPMKVGDQKAIEAKMSRRKRSAEFVSPLPPRTMIFCEGTKTEPHYLREIVTLINEKHREFAMGNRIELSDVIKIKGARRSTTSLLKYAIDNVIAGTSNVWLVYDHDDFPPEQFNETPKMAAARSKNGSIQYHAAWSNECFELWLLLHFISLEANISRAEYMKKLKKWIPGYDKSDTNIYSQLKDRVDTAIANAKLIESKYDKNSTPSDMAPCTTIYKLVEELLRYI